MRSENSKRKFLASAIAAIALLLMIGNRLVSRAESQTSQSGISAKAGDTTQEKIARAMSAGPDNISESARIVNTDAQGNKVILREGSNGFTCMPGNPKVVGEPPMCVDAASMQWFADAKLTNPSRPIQPPASPICWPALRNAAIPIRMTRPACPSRSVPTG